jgi:alpha-L-arabinofuranosidase
LETFRGRWEATEGVLCQRSPGETARAMFGNVKWQDYVLTMKARQTEGAEGLSIFFRGSAGGSFLQWNIGAARKSKHTLEVRQARHVSEAEIVAQAPGAIETNRWYDVCVELEGPQVRCFLDGELVHEATVEPLPLDSLYAVAGRTGDEIIVKAVNVDDEPVEVKLLLNGARCEGVAEIHELSGDPDEVNSLENPRRIAPQTREHGVSGESVDYSMPPNSLTVFRIPAK